MRSPYLVVVINQGLPVKGAIHFPAMIINVVVHNEFLQSFLCIDAGALLLPRDAWFGCCLEIHPDKAAFINVQMNWKETVLFLFEIFIILEAGRFRQISVQAIRPSWDTISFSGRISAFHGMDADHDIRMPEY
jgi:hypothetical protein